MSGPFNLSLDSLKFTGKDVLVIVGLVWATFQVYGRFEAVEEQVAQSFVMIERGLADNKRSAEVGVLEVRISALNMELSYLEGRERNETDQRLYDLKKALVQKLTGDLEDMQ